MTSVVTENAGYLGKSLADLGESTKATFGDLKKQANDGSLVENTKESVTKAASSAWSFTGSLFNKAKNYVEGKEEKKGSSKSPDKEERSKLN